MTRQTELLLLLLLLLAAACTTVEKERPFPPGPGLALLPGEKALVRVDDPGDLPDFAAGFRDKPSLLRAVGQSIRYMESPSSRKEYPQNGITHGRALRSLELFRRDLRESRSSAEFAGKIERHFDVYMSAGYDGRGSVLYTGYYEPVIRASRKRAGAYRFPLYRLPRDLVKDEKGRALGRRTPLGDTLPYYTRKEIDGGGALEGRGLELAWLENALDAYVIHIQGSASLLLADGTIMKVGYAGKNGHPYSSLGAALIRDKKLVQTEASLDRIRAWFRRHPDELFPYLFENKSYVFFTETDGGPYGSIGVEVTPRRTIATDKSIFPRAAVAFLDTPLPARNGEGEIVVEPYRGFALDQDTGGAIRSAGRVDLFFGTGPEAEDLAGRTRSVGRLYYLFARGADGQHAY